MLTAVGAISCPGNAQAQQPLPARASAEVEATGASDERQFRLNYLPTSWERVLHDLADKTGSTLVLHDVPRGRYQRTDRRKYNRDEAVRILNQELEALGFRILAKDEFLTVIEIDRRNEAYPRRVYQETPRGDVPRNTGGRSESGGETRRSRQTTERAEHRIRTDTRSGRRRDSLLRPVAFEESEPIDSSRHDSATSEPSTVTLDTQQPAAAVARKIYSAFESRTEYVEAGPLGLPAFHVYRSEVSEADAREPTGNRAIWFTVELDQPQDQVHLHGAASVTDSLVKLVRLLDVAPAAGGTTARIIPDAGDATQIAQQLKPELAQLQDARAEVEQGDRRFPGSDEEAAAPDVLEESGPGDLSRMREMSLPELIGNLRGDVTVESLPDLDLLILTGNEKDVEAVMNVIRLIEELAVGSAPEIHLLNLRYVDSESLAALLNDAVGAGPRGKTLPAGHTRQRGRGVPAQECGLLAGR